MVVSSFTERQACEHCLDVADQFRAKYPNIVVKIFDGKGVILNSPAEIAPGYKKRFLNYWH